jgi:hypothetical protein
VKADIEKRYGKGAIMDVKKEELDLTKVAEAFGGFIVEKKQFKQGKLFKFKSGAQGEIASGSPEMGGESEKFVKGKKKKFNILTDPDPDADSLAAKSETDLGAKQDVDREIKKAKAEKNLKSKVKTGTTKAGEDASKIARKKVEVTTGKGTMKNRFKQPKFSVGKGGQGQLPLGDTNVTGEMVPSKKPRGRRVKGKSGGRQLQIRGLFKQGRSAKQRPKRVGGKSFQQLKLDTAQATMKGKAGGQIPVPRKEVRKILGTKKNPKTITKLSDIGKSGKQITKQIGKSADVVAKSVPTASKAVSKAAAKSLAKKTITRAGAKFAAKQIPGIGSVISGAEAIGRFASGDVVGGALSAAEMIPGVGLAAGGVNLARDITRTKRVAKVAAKGIKKFTKSKPIKPVTKVIKKLDKKAKKNPLASAAIGGGGVFGATRTGGGGGGAPKIRPTRPKLDQGVVGRRTAG